MKVVLSIGFDGTLQNPISVTLVVRIAWKILSQRDFSFHLGAQSSAMTAMVRDVFFQDGAAWKRSRGILRRKYTRMQYQNLEGFGEHVEKMVGSLRDNDDGLDLPPNFYRLSLETPMAMLLGQSVDNFPHEIADSLPRSFDRASLVGATRARFRDYYWLYAPKGFFTAGVKVNVYTEQCVRVVLQQARETTKTLDRYTFFNELYSEHQEVPPVRDQVIDVLAAGRDTAAATLSYVS